MEFSSFVAKATPLINHSGVILTPVQDGTKCDFKDVTPDTRLDEDLGIDSLEVAELLFLLDEIWVGCVKKNINNWAPKLVRDIFDAICEGLGVEPVYDVGAVN